MVIGQSNDPLQQQKNHQNMHPQLINMDMQECIVKLSINNENTTLKPSVWSQTGWDSKKTNKHQRTRGMKLRKPSIFVVHWVSPYLFFSISTSTAATYIFTTPKCTTTIIIRKPCALNVEFSISYPNLIKFSYFILPSERRVWGWKEAQRQGDFMHNFNIYNYTTQNICTWLWK